MNSKERQETITSHDEPELDATNSQVISLLNNVSGVNTAVRRSLDPQRIGSILERRGRQWINFFENRCNKPARPETVEGPRPYGENVAKHFYEKTLRFARMVIPMSSHPPRGRRAISPPAITVHTVDQTTISNKPIPLVVPSSQHQYSLTEWGHIWWHGIRPGYLSLSLMPILLGTTLAWTQTISKQKPFGQLHCNHLIVTIVIIGCLQIGAHLINNYYDYIRGIDTRNIFGPEGMIQQGHIKPLLVFKVGLWLLGIGTILSIFLAIGLNGLLYLFCFLIIVGGAYFYSALPRTLSILPPAEVIGFFLFGPMLTLYAYITQSKTGLPISVFLYSLPVGLLAMAVIHANNIRNRETDASAHKLTLANLTDKLLSRYLYIGMVAFAYVIILLLGSPHNAPHTVLICLWTLPSLVVVIIRVICTKIPAGFHSITSDTMKLELYFVILLIIGLSLTSLWPVLPDILAHYLSL